MCLPCSALAGSAPALASCCSSGCALSLRASARASLPLSPACTALWLRPLAQRARRARVRQPACSALLRSLNPSLAASSRPSLIAASACVHSGPTTVLVLSLLFIAFVVLLHIWGKFRKG